MSTEDELKFSAEEADKARFEFMLNDSMDPLIRVLRVYQLWWHWADFGITIVEPAMEMVLPPVMVPPEKLEDGSFEFVYPIQDFGNSLLTSKAEDMFTAGMSMCRLYYTIEKMIAMLIDRLKSGGIDTQTEVQVSFRGHELAKRKAFESVINLLYNVLVIDFDPGKWGERYLQNVKRISDKGYGYPSETPRDTYRQHGSSVGTAKIKMK